MLVYLHNSNKCPLNTRTYSFLTHGYLARLQYCITIYRSDIPSSEVGLNERTDSQPHYSCVTIAQVGLGRPKVLRG